MAPAGFTWGAVEHELCLRAGPTWKPGDQPRVPPYQSVTGCRMLGTEGMWHGPSQGRLLFCQGQFSREGSSCELSAANTPRSQGMGALAWERGPGWDTSSIHCSGEPGCSINSVLHWFKKKKKSTGKMGTARMNLLKFKICNNEQERTHRGMHPQAGK